MTTIESGERKSGRPRRFGRGRINTTVRFTPERYTELKSAADAAGRSVSEQVEFLIEDHQRFEKVLGEVVIPSLDRLEARLEEFVASRDKRIATAQGTIDRLQKERASDNERIAEIVAVAVAKTLGRDQQ
jgi:hypothetical protein